MQLDILTPKGRLKRHEAASEKPGEEKPLEVDSVNLPGAAGELGVLRGHVALVTELRPGLLTYKQGAQQHTVAIGAGFAHIAGPGKERVTVLADAALAPEDIDTAAAAKDLDAAQKDLTAAAPADRPAAENRVRWAQARLAARR